MQSVELSVIGLNIIILLVAYFSIYPKLAGVNINQVAWLDLLASCIALFIVGYKYWGTNQVFDLLIIESNWFWFTLITYVVLEIPLSLWYFRKVLFDKGN